MLVRSYVDGDQDAVIALWQDVFGYGEARNQPAKVLDDKLALGDGLVFVALHDGEVVGTAMAGYDGHRGWLYRVGVVASARKLGVGSQLVRAAEAALRARGCAKINLQTHSDNEAAIAFWQRMGYAVEARVSFGKEL